MGKWLWLKTLIKRGLPLSSAARFLKRKMKEFEEIKQQIEELKKEIAEEYDARQ